VSLPWWATAVLWAQDERGWKFGSRELEREASMRASRTETRSHEIFKDGRTVADFNHWMLGKRGPSIHPIYANLVNRNSGR
jgi:hypothetical protein